MVNLDGAFAAANDNMRILEQVAALGVPVQFGGGLRSADDMSRAIDSGATRIVLGTIAIQQPEAVSDAIARWGAEAITIALDARDGKITTHGWQEQAELTPVKFSQQMAERGACHALYTDVSRDGKLSGVDVEGTANLARQTGLSVIASGGVSGIDDIRRLAQTHSVAGVVIGMALYRGNLNLAEALAAAGENDAG
jgi:phosphoribosylformimino-5-aminoimidazole carboxamide ribotide isomerase